MGVYGVRKEGCAQGPGFGSEKVERATKERPGGAEEGMGWRSGEEAKASGAPGERVGSLGALSKQPCSSFKRDRRTRSAWRRVPCKYPICGASRQAVTDRAPPGLGRLSQGRWLGQPTGESKLRARASRVGERRAGGRGRKLRGLGRD